MRPKSGLKFPRPLYSCPQDVEEAAYKGLARPVLEDGSSVWDPITYGLQEELEKGPKSCCKVCDWKLYLENGILGQLKSESLVKNQNR